MADEIDDYLKGAKGASAPTPAPTSPAPTSQQPIDSATGKPWASSGNALWDLITKPVGKTESPLTAAADYGLSAYDAATFGYGVPSALKNRVNQAHEDLGPMDYLAQGIGYGVGPGKILGPMARGITRVAAPAVVDAAAPLATRIAGSMAAGGLEGAGAGGLGAAGHGGGMGDIAQGAIMGGITGAAAGAAGGSGPEPKVPDVGSPGTGSSPATGMYAKKATEYAPLDNIYFDKSTAVRAANQGAATIRAQRDPANLGASSGISPDVRSIVNNVIKDPVVTGRGLQEASRDLRGLDNGNNWQAHRIADQFDGALQNATPIQGGGPGDASVAKGLGDLWHGRIRDLETLGDQPTAANVKQVQDWHPDSSTPQAQALDTLASAQQPKFNWWLAKKAVAPLAGAAVGGAEGFFNSAEGQNPWVNAAMHAGEDAAVFSGLHHLAAANPAAATRAARFAIATGRPITTPMGGVGDALKTIALGRAAGNQSPY